MPDDPNICGGADRSLSREELEDAVHQAGANAENVPQASADRAACPPSRDAIRLAQAVRVAQALRRLQLGR